MVNMTSRKLRDGIDFRSNWLYVDRALLTVEGTSPDELGRILTVGSGAIRAALLSLYEATKLRNPGGDIQEPWLQTIQLCMRGDEPRILTTSGLEPPYKEITKTVHEDSQDIITALHPYWDVAAYEFDVRVVSHLEGWDAAHDGTWLQVRPPLGADK